MGDAGSDSYFVLEERADVGRKWRAVVASGSDVVKVFLLDSDRYASLLADTLQLDRNGLDPRLVPSIVAAAHRSGRRVAAHIETAADFRVAVMAGVDIIAHLPGLAITNAADSVRAVIAPADAKRAAARSITVIPTAWLATLPRISRGDTAQIALTMRVERQNLRTLRQFGVRLAIGSDGFANPARESQFLLSLGVFSNADVLRLWSQDTPQLVFPNRRIGRLDAGYEASFLALTCNPLVTFSCTDSIAYRMRQGRPLSSTR
jgi:imidazolonepropionase-like amidohydrolase